MSTQVFPLLKNVKKHLKRVKKVRGILRAIHLHADTLDDQISFTWNKHSSMPCTCGVSALRRHNCASSVALFCSLLFRSDSTRV